MIAARQWIDSPGLPGMAPVRDLETFKLQGMTFVRVVFESGSTFECSAETLRELCEYDRQAANR